ncbi:acetate--CoA ligase family protein [Hydrogenophaga sp. BPS33]|uniref:acetate--CoA ligase family protein n=1 Tax=Hydrogenophaga sp. BPS33 TaxID=2651974 RepID=UPI00131F6802|nr:acetate--CoA ligase family protein [Hydrogenophaga sp. BPS33]QHE84337.1 acetate--CoA ligase family protein [Hydrogenophaga sp. BPS33]
MTDLSNHPVLQARAHPRSLDALLNPHSVAILGASADATKIGGRPVKFLRTHGFSKPIYPVNPRATEVQGLPAYASLADIPAPVDHVIVALPGQAVLPAVRLCAERGVRAVTVFSSGFAEVGEEGRAAQEELGAIARDSGMRILGPNCMGFMNLRTGFLGTFAFMVDLGLPPLGRVALVSQSGAFGGQALVMARERGLPLGAWVTTGNECDVELADCIAHFAQDPHTDVIMGYMEGCKSPQRLIKALALAQAAGKPVIMVKAGRSDVGRAAVQSHTGALAGDDRVFDALFHEYGVHRAHSVEDFFDVARACATGVMPREGRVGVFTVSGGIGVLTADAAEQHGLELTPMPAAAQAQLQALLPHASVRNPVDGTAQIWADMQVFETFLRTMLQEGHYECVLLFLTAMPHAPHLQAPLADILTRLRQEFPQVLLVLSMLAPAALSQQMQDAGYLLFEDTTRAMRAVAALKSLASARQRYRAARPLRQAIPLLPELSAQSLAEARTEHAAKQVLNLCGIAAPTEQVVTTAEEAIAAARKTGYPIVLKVLSPDIVHKTEVGGVALNLRDDHALANAWREMMARVRREAPDARIEGALVAPMVGPGLEFIVGVQRDPIFGPVIVAGLGGVFVELFNDVALRIAPVSHEQAHEMLRELRAYPLLQGHRGAPAADVEALADAIVRLSQLAVRHAESVESIEINPLRVFPTGQGVLALDAVVLPRGAAA